MTSLESVGLKALLESQPQFLGCEMDVCIYGEVELVGSELEKIDFFIIDSATFALHPDFFVPRKSRTVILTRDKNKPKQAENGKGTLGSGIRFIYRDSTEEEMNEILGMAFTEPERSQETSGELSAREKEVLKELASGKTNKEIADHLSISVNTVITHRKNVSSKLGIKSVSGLSLYALMNGII